MVLLARRASSELPATGKNRSNSPYLWLATAVETMTYAPLLAVLKGRTTMTMVQFVDLTLVEHATEKALAMRGEGQVQAERRP